MTPPLFDERAAEAAAYGFASHVGGIFRRNPDDPVDVCRFHRDIAPDILAAAVAALDRDALIERVAEVIYWAAPWEIQGYRPPTMYGGAQELARVVLTAIGLGPQEPVLTSENEKGGK